MSKAAAGFYIGTDTRVTLRGLVDSLGTYIADAGVSGILKTKQGQRVTGGAVAFNHVENSNGDYVGELSSSAQMTPNTEYDLVINASRGGRQLTIKVTRTAGYIVA